MVGLATVILAEGVKGFFENSAYLLGIPLVDLGAAGLLLVLSPINLTWPDPSQPEIEVGDEWVAVAAEAEVEGHPTPVQYVTVGLILGAVTALEVAVYYVDVLEGALLGILVVLSALKFVLVLLWFMHLRFDSQLFSTLFAGGLALAAALFIVVLATLGASLV